MYLTKVEFELRIQEGDLWPFEDFSYEISAFLQYLNGDIEGSN